MDTVHETIRLKIEKLLERHGTSLTPQETNALHKLSELPTIGLVIYGSLARGDFSTTSDIDLMAVSPSARGARQADRLSISFFTLQQLKDQSRSLFVYHLKRDGNILYDKNNLLKDFFTSIPLPDPTQIIKRVTHFSQILDFNKEQIVRHLEGFISIARYLARTAVYADAIADGNPCFSVQELSVRYHNPDLKHLLTSHPGIFGGPTFDKFQKLLAVLQRHIGAIKQNQYPTLEALALSVYQSDPLLASAAIRVGLPYSIGANYTELERVAL